MKYRYHIDIDIDNEVLENIDNETKEILENINIDIDKEILENIDIDKKILENIDIDKILNRAMGVCFGRL